MLNMFPSLLHLDLFFAFFYLLLNLILKLKNSYIYF
jgi:hypothetical protein